MELILSQDKKKMSVRENGKTRKKLTACSTLKTSKRLESRGKNTEAIQIFNKNGWLQFF